jgi:cell wall-associated NlpC family hydrolase
MVLTTQRFPNADRDLDALRSRVQQRRQAIQRRAALVKALPQLVASAVHPRLWLNRVPGRLWLHLVVALVVPTAVLLSPQSHQLSPTSVTEMPDRASATLDGIPLSLGPISLMSEPEAYEGDQSVPDSAFAEILALPETQAIIARSEILAPMTFSSRVLGDQVNVRSGPGLIYDVTGKLSAGTPLTLEGVAEDWFVGRTTEGQQVWIAAELVSEASMAQALLPPAGEIPPPPPPKVATVREDGLSVRDGPGTAYVKLHSVQAGTTIDLLSRYESWFEVRLPAGQIGWVTSEFLTIGDGVVERIEQLTSAPDLNPALVATTDGSTNLRSGPSTAFPKLETAGGGLQLDLVGRYQDWFKVRTPAGKSAWVSSEVLAVSPYVARRVPVVREVPTLPRPQSVATRGRGGNAPPLSAEQAGSVVAFAMQFRGVPYVWGGASPAGFDCSGFTTYVYRQFGLQLPRTAEAQYSQRYGVFVDRSNLQPGDIVFFANTYKRGISHVGIYVGGGMVVQALAKGVPLSAVSMNSGYWQSKYYGALRPKL